MTEYTVAIDELVKTEREMTDALIDAMPDHHREFLKGNLDKLKPEQRTALVKLLRSSLEWRA